MSPHPRRPENAAEIVRHLKGTLFTLESDLADLRRMWPDPADTNQMRKRIFAALQATRRKVEGAILNLEWEHRR